MNIVCGEKGIQIKKLFGSREILYSDISSVVFSDREYTFTTKSGEVFAAKFRFFDNPALLYEAVQKYNIHFSNADELSAQNEVYPVEQVNEKSAQVKAVIEEYAGRSVREKMGAEYGVDAKVGYEGEWINMYLKLLKNGQVVTDISEKAKYTSDDVDPYAFDNIALAYLVEWDGFGRYALTNEMDNPQLCEAYLKEPLEYLFENYKK